MSPALDLREWDRCAGWLAAALEHSLGGWTVADLRKGVLIGAAQFWPGERSAMITRIESYPRGKVIEGVACGGDGDELVSALIPRAEAWAKAQGCGAAHIAGRLGWARKLKAHGYEPLYTVICKEL